MIEDTPDHLPETGIFKMYDIIDGTLEIVPLKGNKWDLSDYDIIYEHFKEVSALDRKYLSQYFCLPRLSVTIHHAPFKFIEYK